MAKEKVMDELISRQAAIDAIDEYDFDFPNYMERFVTELRDAMKADIKHDIEALPSAQSTLYGYQIEHLAYIARVMQKEGVTAEYAVRTFDDMSRAIRMIIDEAQQKTEEMLNERFNFKTGGD